jgi:predicted short-subunit dehydrogenase-like oxidoreductase (DUF2520 family)
MKKHSRIYLLNYPSKRDYADFIMKKNHYYKFSIIGLGKVGTAIGYLLKKAGHKIVAISDKSTKSLTNARRYTGGKTYLSPLQSIANADCILITTPDDFILPVCEDIAHSKAIAGKFVFHMSGAGSLDLLQPAKKAGAFIASIHPVQSFSSIDNAIQCIPGSVFGITAEKKAEKQAKQIVVDLGGVPFFISARQKPLYHAAACLASNYLVTLLYAAESIYQSVGINKTNATRAYLPLVHGTLKNIEKSGSIQALTGPIARGDSGTVQKHIDAIKKTCPQFLPLYSALGLITNNIAQKKGTLNSRQTKKISNILKGAIDHEHSK